MNLNQLEYFLCAAETLNFTRAAARCFISQTAMTQQIHALEKTVGVPLFVRDKHHVELTTAGVVYMKEAKRILEYSEEAVRLARMAAEGAEGELTIGYITGFGESDAPRILKGFHSAYPNIKLKLIRDTSSGLMEALQKGDCDVAFTLTSGQFRDPYSGIKHRYLKSYPLMAVVGDAHPLSSCEQVHYSDLSEEKFIIMQPAGRSRDQMEELMLIYDRGGFVPEILTFNQEPESILLMVSSGLGICLMPEYIVRNHKNNPNLRLLPLQREDGGADTLDIEIAWRQDNANPSVEKILQYQMAMSLNT